MPKATRIINKFKAGLHAELDARDLPEGAISYSMNVMTDIEGKIRQMAGDERFASLFIPENTGLVHTPGYGLFTFGSDQRVKDNINDILGDIDQETTLLVYQDGNAIGFYDTEAHPEILKLGNIIGGVKPVFYYSLVDGALRVCDSNYNNMSINTDAETSEQTIDYYNSNLLTKYIKFMNKTWFSGLSGYEISHKGWINNETDGLDSFIYPPTIYQYGTPLVLGATNADKYTLVYENATNASSTIGAAQMYPGNIAIQVSDGGANDNSDWLAQTLYKFGVSFTYEGGQESQVTNFTETWGLALSDDGDDIELRVYVKPDDDVFDPRITGYNVYLTGDDSGLYEDPYFLAEFYWGSSSLDPPRLTTSDGTYTEAFEITNATIRNTNAQVIVKTPVITYSMRNGYRTDSKTIAINSKTSVIANRRCYSGNVRRYAFDIHALANQGINGGQNADWRQPNILRHSSFIERDTMMVSPVDKYDIFPEDNTLNVGNNDGDHIVLLMEYADRLLQFKENKLYIINISEDIEFIESEHDFKGIKYPYQATNVDGGIAWLNDFGCFYYNGEEVINLIEGKIARQSGSITQQLQSWESTAGSTSMIGYIPKNKQIVVFADPNLTSANGSKMWIYDMLTESWAYGVDLLTWGSKSNAITKYNNSLLYMVPEQNVGEDYSQVLINSFQGATDEVWVLNNVSSVAIETDPQGSQLLIGTTAITPIMNYPGDVNNEGDGTITFGDYLITKIQEATNNDFEFELDEFKLMIIRKANKIDGTYTGRTLSWSTASSMGAPVGNITQTLSPLVSDASNKFFEYIDGSDYSFDFGPFGEVFAASGVVWEGMGTQDMTNGESPFHHSINIGWSEGPKQFMPDIFQFIGSHTTVLGGSGFYQRAHDEPRIKISRVDGSSYIWADASTATQFVVDLYSKYFFDNKWNFVQSIHNSPANIGSNFSGNHYGNNGFDYGTVSVHANPNYDGELIDSYSNPLQMNVAYTSAIEEDGSSEDTVTDNGSTLKQYKDANVGASYYEALSTIAVPTMIFTDQAGAGGAVSEVHKIIIIPGAYGNVFIPGESYTFANTGQAANNQTYVIDDVWQLTVHGKYFVDEEVIEMNNHYRTITYIKYLASDNSSFFSGVLNWTTFDDVTITGVAGMTAIGTHTLGRLSRKQQELLLPRRYDNHTLATAYKVNIVGQDMENYNGMHYINPGVRDSEYEIASMTTDGLWTDFMNRTTAEKPWWDMFSRYQIPRVSRLFCANGLGVTTTGDLNNSYTSPFLITLASGITKEQVFESVKVGDVLLAKSGSNWEAMYVSAHNHANVTVTRNYLNQSSTGSAVNFGTADIDWYKLRTWKRTSSTTFEINGGDYRQLFKNGTRFTIDLYQEYDTGDANQIGVNQTCYAEQVSYASATNTTTVTISTDHTDNLGNAGDIVTYLLGGSAVYAATPGDPATSEHFKDNMDGYQPGNESISFNWNLNNGQEYVPDAGGDTSNTTFGNTGMYSGNRLIMIYGTHIIYQPFDEYPFAQISTEISNGVSIYQLRNSSVDSYTDLAKSVVQPAFTTADFILDDDLGTSKVLYDVTVSYRSSGNIRVYAGINNSHDGNGIELESDGSRGGRGHGSGGRNTSPETWQSVKFRPTEPIKHMRSIKISVYGDSHSTGFEVNDIVITYRSLDKGR